MAFKERGRWAMLTSGCAPLPRTGACTGWSGRTLRVRKLLSDNEKSKEGEGTDGTNEDE